MRKLKLLAVRWSRGVALALAAVVAGWAVFTAKAASPEAASAEALPSVAVRFSAAQVEEVPDLQRHLLPLVGRLGCNSRACHGSFQGQGGFMLSLFGYDFKADHDALTQGKTPRVNVEKPDQSLIITKPTSADEHEGGERYKLGGWQHALIRRWIEAGAKYSGEIHQLAALQVTPAEIVFAQRGDTVQLRAVAVWADGAREDVTPLCRFQTNNEQYAKIDENGLVTALEAGDTHVVAFYDNAVIPVPVMRPVSAVVGAKYPKVATPTKIDEHVVAKLRKLGVVPSELCDDAEFLRRVSLDLTGTLPSAAMVKEFLADNSPNKRAELVDKLLASPAYAAWWTTKLCDFTGNNPLQLQNASPVRGGAEQEWYDWIHQRVAANAPYDQIVEGMVTAVSRTEDQSYTEFCEQMSALYREGSDKKFADLPHLTHYWARRNFRVPEDRAIGFAYTFLGIRIQCAQCHKHPFDQWSKQDFEQFKQFFARVTTAQGARREDKDEYDAILKKLGLESKGNGDRQRELPKLLAQGKVAPFPEVYVESSRAPQRRGGNNAAPASGKAKLLGGAEVDVAGKEDPRDALMAWLREPQNPYFARAWVNRVWAGYFNVGIVEPPDDLSLANPPANKPLLDYLAEGFVASGFDMKWVHREIIASDTYQRSWRPNATNRHDEKNFSRAVPRRLPAEVLYDAVQAACASDAKTATQLVNLEGRAIGAPAAVRAGGSSRNYALQVFGRSTRESNCDCDRSLEPSLLQTVYLQNDREVLDLIDARDGWIATLARGRDAKADAKAEAMSEANLAELATEAYLRTLSRRPSEAELARAVEYLKADRPLSELRGLLWALVNTKEFVVNH